MIRRIALGAVSALAITAMVPAAMAADLPAYEAPAPVVAVPSFTWTGPYIGVQAGYSWGSAARANKDGFLVGGYAGYNVQLDNSPVVLGIETDFNYADIDGRHGRARVDSDWNGATRARVGYAFDRFLVYAAGGVAYADRNLRIRGSGSDSKTALGWTVGGGVEYAATDDVAVRAEYRYNDYGKDRFNIGGRSEYTDHSVRVGVAYKFTSPF